MANNIVTFPGAGRTSPISSERQRDEPEQSNWRDREAVKQDIDQHIAARKAYEKAVAWTVAAECQNLPPAQIEEARKDAAVLYEEMQHCARCLIICMPTDPRALVDLLMYLEKNFSLLPHEISGRSLAFELLKRVRLSLRGVTRYGKHGLS